jgi:hypothetical protein
VQAHVDRAGRVELDQGPGGEVRRRLQVRQHAPAHAEQYRGEEVGGRRHVVRRRRPHDTRSAQVHVLEVVGTVEHHDGGRGEGGRGDPVAEESPDDAPRGHRPVPHRPQRGGAAPCHWPGLRRHGGDDGPVAQQRAGARLVLPPDVGEHRVRDRRERREHPGRERVGVDRDRQHRASAVRGKLPARVREQQADLSRGPQEHLACGGRAHRPAPDEQDLPRRRLERPQPLAHGGRRHVQDAGGGVEAAAFHGGDEGTELIEVDLHVSQANAAAVLRAGLQNSLDLR